jgi:protein ImuA
VVAEVGGLAKLAGRRLHLACLAHGGTGFVLRRWPHGVKAGGVGPLTAVATRWRLATAPSVATDGLREPGAPRWHVELTQARGGRPGAWLMELEGSDAPVALRVVAGLADAAPATRAVETDRRIA